MLGGSGGSPGALALPYTITFNGYANKAAMIAAYAEIGITVPPLLDGSTFDSGVALLLTEYGEDTGATGIPYDSTSPGVKSPYLFINALGLAYPWDYTITLPLGTLCRQVAYDRWRLSENSLQLIITYDDASTDTQGSPTPGSPSTPFTAVAVFPTTPAVGKYITSLTFRHGADGTRWALDNIQLLP